MRKKEKIRLMILCLTEAKKRLWDGRGRMLTVKDTIFICYAIDDVPEATYEIRELTKNAISRGISNCVTFETWIIRTYGLKVREDMRLSDLQKMCHRWIDQIIRDWTKQMEEM